MLQTLDIHDNRFLILPSEIVRLGQLTNLNISNNQIAVLPAELVWLEGLERLNVENNELRTVPSEIGQLYRLRRLDLRNNKLEVLPLSFGRLASLSASWRGDFNPRKDGLLLEGNPLPHIISSLIAGGQPAATKNVLGWLRGEIEPERLPHTSEQAEPASNSEQPPPLPLQGVGPHFEVDEKGVIRFAPPNALDRQGNNVRRLRALHPTICSLSRELCESLGRGNSPHGYLCSRIQAYLDLVDQELPAVDFSVMYIEGVRISNAAKATAEKINQGELPPLELAERKR